MAINYTEKGPGMHAAIEAAGWRLEERFGFDSPPYWWADNEPAVQAIIDAYTLDQLKVEVCAAITAHAKALRDLAVAAISPGEMASWPIKRAEAAAYTASGNASAAPMLSAEAAARGVGIDVLVTRVTGNATRLAMLEAAISGTDGRHRDAVNALTTFDDVLAYDWHTGWPM